MNGAIKFEPTQDGFHSESESFFGWNSTSTADGICNTGNYSENSDPCYNVAPVGTWMTPNAIMATALINSGYEWDDVEKGTWFGEGQGENRVFLPAVGFRASIGPGTGEITPPGEYAYYSLKDYSMDHNQAIFVWSTPMVAPEIVRTWGLPIRCVKIDK